MQVFAKHNIASQMVHFYVQIEPGVYVVHPWELKTVGMGAEAPVYLSLPQDIAARIGTAAENAGLQEPATERHLRDVMKSRDWAFGIVERLIIPPGSVVG